MTRQAWIEHWDPDDSQFWQREGKRIAWRNLAWSILAEHLGFSVWLIWSVVATRLPAAGFPYTTDQLFQLVALPGVVGALMRFPYTFAVPRFGGRNWTVVSALLLLVPTVSLSVLVTQPTTPFWLMSLVAATAGVGGGNFASSMANISFFFPDREKGFALALNATGGNIGVASVQLLVPIAIGYAILPGTDASGLHLENAGLVWVPLILVAAACAWMFMNNLSSARSRFRDQLTVARRNHTWIMSWLYIGTFGSFVGFSAAFPLLLKTQFPEVTMSLAFLGPLVGSIARPLGGKLADHLGGARVTYWNFLAMMAAALCLAWALSVKSFPLFVSTFLVLFVTTGIGNGSTYRMIPIIVRAFHVGRVQRRGREPDAEAAAEAEALQAARRETATVIGVVAAIGALGGYFVPGAFGASIRATGTPLLAIECFVGFYLTCVVTTWWCYMRTAVPGHRMPSPADARA